MFNWDEVFKNAHLTSWPVAGISIQNANPAPTAGGRNIFKEDYNEIMKAAKKYGYVMSSRSTDKVINFYNKEIDVRKNSVQTS